MALPGRAPGAHTRQVALVGPGGWRIDQITITRGDSTRTVLRVRRYGSFVAEVRSVEELVDLGVDLAALTDETDPPDQPD